MNNIEEQVEKLARLVVDYEGEEGDARLTLGTYSATPTGLLPLEVGTELVRYEDVAALLPLEVTDGEARTKPYRCADCDQPHGPFNNIGSGQSNKPEVTYRLVCDRCWGPKPAAPVEVTDGEARITDEMVEAGAKANFEDRTMGREMEPWSEFKHDPRSEIWLRSARIVLSAALTQKGDNE